MDDVTYDLEADESRDQPKRPGFPVEPRRLLLIVAENRKPLLRAFLIASAIALIAFFFLPVKYETSAQLLYEGSPLPERKDKEPTPSAFVESAIAPTRLGEVRDRLGWEVSLDDLKSQIKVTLEGEAAMRIVGNAGTAEDAQALTQTVLDVFLAQQSSFNAKKLQRLTAENEVALERAKERRAEASEAYEAFRKKSGRSDLIKEQEQLLARTALLRAKADEAAVEAAAQQARIAELQKAQRELPRQIMGSAKKGSPVDAPLAKARSELAAAQASLSEHHPTVQALKQRVASLQAQRKGQGAEVGEQTFVANPARTSVDQQVAAARAALAGAKERESALRVLLKAIQDEAGSLAPEEGKARQVVGDLKLATDRVKQLSDRAATLRDAALGPLTGFRVLSAPVLPEEKDRSGLQVLLLILLPVFTVLIFALVFIARRLRDLTVEAPREVAWWGNGPVLGTSIWPRDPDALESFVDELEDHGVYGAGRTLVVPATEAEREIACSFAMRLAEAPWLAAAILDVEDRARRESRAMAWVSSEYMHTPRLTPPVVPLRRLSSHAGRSAGSGRVIRTPAPKPTMQGFAPPAGGSTSPPPPVVTPPPGSEPRRTLSSRPPRKKTMIGLPAVQSSGPPPAQPSSDQEPFHADRSARATVRMVVPATNGDGTQASSSRHSDGQEEAFLLTRPVPVATDEPSSHVGQAVLVGSDSPHANASNAVMRAAVRLLGDDDDDITGLRRSEPPTTRLTGEVTGVALAWNGPLSGPVLRRAARLAHRVMVVVSSGMNAIDLTRVQTRLGREKGVGYVLVNVDDAYVDLHDRVGPVEAFWEGLRDSEAKDSRRF